MSAVVALFPGQGSQRVGMARELASASEAADAVLRRADAALPGLLELMWEGPEDALRLTANQQPALVAAGAAAYAAFRAAGGPLPAFAAGHSLGEYTALVAAGSLAVEDAVRLVRARGDYMQEAVPEGVGAMAAVLKVDDATVAAALAEVANEGVVAVANLNAPGQTVISGHARAVAAASDLLKQRGARAIPLRVSAPFHCPLMAPAADRLAADLAAAVFGPLEFPVVANVTARPLAGPEDAPRLLTEQVVGTVRWVETLRYLGAEVGHGARFIEFGAGEVLTNLVRRTLPEVEALAVQDPDSLAEVLA